MVAGDHQAAAMTAILALLGRVPLRVWIELAGVAAVGFLIWREHHAVHLYQAERVARVAADARAAGLDYALARDHRIADELSTFRNQQHADFKAFDEKVTKTEITHEVRYETATGEQVVCHDRDAAVYRRLFDEAVTGAATP